MPLCLCASRRARGISLLEVLISMGVLSVGLLGFAMLIPVGRLSIVEAGKADRSGACGRAALREVKVRRMLSVLDNNNNSVLGAITLAGTEASDSWTPMTTVLPFAIDPLGVANSLTGALGGVVPRYTMSNLVFLSNGTLQSRYQRKTSAEQVFLWQDAKGFDLPGIDNAPGDVTQRARGQFIYPNFILYPPPKNSQVGMVNAPLVYVNTNNNTICVDPATNAIYIGPAPVNRYLYFDPATGAIYNGPSPGAGYSSYQGTPNVDGNYSWLLTVVPSMAEANLPLAQKTRFTVSVAVCYKRSFVDAEQQRGADSNSSVVIPGNVWAGTVQLSPSVENLKANQWIVLYGTNPSFTPRYSLQWYRVVSVNNADDGTQWLTLMGPDWDASTFPSTQTIAVVITGGQGTLSGVIGVYTTTIDVGRDVVW